jgi:integrase
MHAQGWLFPGQHTTKPISTRHLHRIVVEAAQAAEIAKRVGPHTLRHSFATRPPDGSTRRVARCRSSARLIAVARQASPCGGNMGTHEWRSGEPGR